MSNIRIFRFQDSASLADRFALMLIQRLAELSSVKETVNLGLTGGRVAHTVYTQLADRFGAQEIDTSKIHLWWSDERFVPTTSPERNSQQALSVLAQTMALIPSQIHLMPAADGQRDPDEAAFAYATELGDIRFDICLLGMGEDGHIASIFPDHPSFDPQATNTVIGVTESPKPPSERITMTLPAINQSTEIWMMATGKEKASAAARAINGDPTIPAGHLVGTSNTYWFLDFEAASELPYYECLL